MALVAIIITVAIFRGGPILSTLEFALVLTVVAGPIIGAFISVGFEFILKGKATDAGAIAQGTSY